MKQVMWRSASTCFVAAATWTAPVAQAVEACARVELTAAKSYAPPTWFDADQTVAHPIRFSVPAVIPVIRGNSGDAPLTLIFGRVRGEVATCRFRGAAREQQQQHVTKGASRGTYYRLTRCDNGAVAGDTVSADRFKLHLDSGDAPTGPTTVRLVLDELGGQCVPIGSLSRRLADPSGPADVAALALELYSGDFPLQRGVRPGAIDLSRVSILTGRAITKEGKPIAQVTVSIVGHPEYGTTFTGDDGAFHMAVDGGSPVVMKLESGGMSTTLTLQDLAK